MNNNLHYWMKKAVSIAASPLSTMLRVGAVLISQNEETFYTAANGEIPFQSWKDVLLSKIKRTPGKNQFAYLFLTVNTLNDNSVFDLAELLEEFSVDQIFLGLPDPKLGAYLDDDPVLQNLNIERFPDELQIEILEQNSEFYLKSSQNIQNSKYYARFRVSKLVQQTLYQMGYNLPESEFKNCHTKVELANLLMRRFNLDEVDSFKLVDEALSQAFDLKYGNYEYVHDTRIINDWAQCFLDLLEKSSEFNLQNADIINVGVGGGNEAAILFGECNNITYVDIAQAGLLKIKEANVNAKILQSSSDDLVNVSASSFDLYISLRTYNSSFFNLQGSISEAHRVLRKGGSLILSIANGFLDSNHQQIITGLLIPKTYFVDIYRGIHTVNLIIEILLQFCFENIQCHYTKTEIYIAAKK